MNSKKVPKLSPHNFSLKGIKIILKYLIREYFLHKQSQSISTQWEEHFRMAQLAIEEYINASNPDNKYSFSFYLCRSVFNLLLKKEDKKNSFPLYHDEPPLIKEVFCQNIPKNYSRCVGCKTEFLKNFSVKQSSEEFSIFPYFLFEESSLEYERLEEKICSLLNSKGGFLLIVDKVHKEKEDCIEKGIKLASIELTKEKVDKSIRDKLKLIRKSEVFEFDVSSAPLRVFNESNQPNDECVLKVKFILSNLEGLKHLFSINLDKKGDLGLVVKALKCPIKNSKGEFSVKIVECSEIYNFIMTQYSLTKNVKLFCPCFQHLTRLKEEGVGPEIKSCQSEYHPLKFSEKEAEWLNEICEYCLKEERERTLNDFPLSSTGLVFPMIIQINETMKLEVCLKQIESILVENKIKFVVLKPLETIQRDLNIQKKKMATKFLVSTYILHLYFLEINAEKFKLLLPQNFSDSYQLLPIHNCIMPSGLYSSEEIQKLESIFHEVFKAPHTFEKEYSSKSKNYKSLKIEFQKNREDIHLAAFLCFILTISKRRLVSYISPGKN